MEYNLRNTDEGYCVADKQLVEVDDETAFVSTVWNDRGSHHMTPRHAFVQVFAVKSDAVRLLDNIKAGIIPISEYMKYLIAENRLAVFKYKTNFSHNFTLEE